MSWVVVGVAGASALMSMNQAKRQAEAQRAQNMAAAAQTQYSPWTNMGAGKIDTSAGQSELEGALSGGLKGFMTGKSIEKGLAGSGTPTPGDGSSANSLGGTDMSNKLGEQGHAFEATMPGQSVSELSAPQFGVAQQEEMPTLMGNKPRFKAY